MAKASSTLAMKPRSHVLMNQNWTAKGENLR
jgi:hypothetical protein